MTFDPQQSSAHPYLAQQPYAQPQPQHRNSFADIPVSDWIRDAGALALLLISLALSWTYGTAATGHIEVILITLLSIFSLAITYLARAGVFGPTVGFTTVWLFRFLVNLPYVLLVLVYVVIDAVNSTGLGGAVALGLTGAIIAIQPRAAELGGLDLHTSIARIWRGVALSVLIFAFLTYFVSIILLLVSFLQYGGYGISPLAVISQVLAIAFGAAVLVTILAGVIRRNSVWLWIGIALGGTAVSYVLIIALASGSSAGSLGVAGIESIRGGGYPVLLLSVVLALCTSPALRLSTLAMDPVARWFAVASAAALMSILVAAFILLTTIMGLIVAGVSGSATVSSIGTIVISTIVLIVGIIARTVLRSNPSGSQWTVITLTGVAAIVGIVHIVVNQTAFSGPAVGLLWILAYAFGLPAITVVAMTAPPAVRAYFAQFGPQREPAVRPGYGAPIVAGYGVPHPAPVPTAAQPAPVAPAPIPAHQPAPSVTGDDFLAIDPATPTGELFRIAQESPRLWPQLAANPSTYPDLLAWLAQSTDAAVHEALRMRLQ